MDCSLWHQNNDHDPASREQQVQSQLMFGERSCGCFNACSLSLSLCLSLGSSCNGVDRPRSRCIFRDLRPAGPVSAGHLRGFSGPDKPDQTSRTGRTTADGIRTHTSLTHYSGGLPLSPPSPSRRHQRTPLRPSRRRARAPHATDARAPR